MKLSTAIREGCKRAPRKCTRRYGNEQSGEACALGAAAIAACGHTVYLKLNETFPELDRVAQTSSGEWMFTSLRPNEQTSLWCAIANANDNTNLTREEIADILERNGL